MPAVNIQIYLLYYGLFFSHIHIHKRKQCNTTVFITNDIISIIVLVFIAVGDINSRREDAGAD